MKFDDALVERLARRLQSHDEIGVRCFWEDYKPAIIDILNELFDWQPIDTAPKDESWFLSIGNDGSKVPRSARWDEDMWTDEYLSMLEPTHWLPMIPLPEVN